MKKTILISLLVLIIAGVVLAVWYKRQPTAKDLPKTEYTAEEIKIIQELQEPREISTVKSPEDIKRDLQAPALTSPTQMSPDEQERIKAELRK